MVKETNKYYKKLYMLNFVIRIVIQTAVLTESNWIDLVDG